MDEGIDYAHHEPAALESSGVRISGKEKTREKISVWNRHNALKSPDSDE
jgi:hypothetical protein